MLPIPYDFAIEYRPPAKLYQHCLPQVFRIINSVTDISAEIFDMALDNRSATTDFWETAHFQSMSTDWEDELSMLKNFGFSAIFDGNNIAKFSPDKEYDHTFGYFDEGIFPLPPHRKARSLIVREYSVSLGVRGSISCEKAKESNVLVMDGFYDTLATDPSPHLARTKLSAVREENGGSKSLLSSGVHPTGYMD
jgi:hypothetical protein